MLEKSDLDLLIQELTGVKQKWYEIGVGVGLNVTVDKIRSKYSDPDVCLRKFSIRLQKDYTTITWRNIVDALRSPGVGESQLADQLEAKYCPSEFINDNILLYFSEYNVVQHCTRSTPHKV